ncbi:MAG: SpoIIE family protein phosphatase, partial [Leptospiraceae bacterium]|nr:SpoIIE family protein phosphatase [Leptospiraceae bacterium]
RRTHPRLTIGITAIYFSVAVLWGVYFAIETFSAPRVYKFAGHYWDFDADAISHKTGLLILFYLFSVYIVGFWRAIIIKSHRWAILGMTLAFLLATLVPGITNVLSRDGALDRGTHQTMISLTVITGFFILLIIYINTTHDHTTFMAKLAAISLATFMLILTPISLFTLLDKEAAYDQIHRRESQLVLDKQLAGRAADEESPDLRYIVRYNFKNDDHNVTYRNNDDVQLHFNEMRTEHRNAYVRARILALPSGLSMVEFEEQLQRIIEDAHREFAGYGRALLAINRDLPPDTRDRAAATLAVIDEHYREVLTDFNKIHKIPDDGFREGVRKYISGNLESEEAFMHPFAQVIAQHLEVSGAEGAELKEQVTEYLRSMKPLGDRHFRQPAPTGNRNIDYSRDRYIGFIRADLENNSVIEVGFSYLEYRSFIHQAAVKLGWIVIAILIIVLAGFRVFFYGALVSPLEKLLSGVKRVNEGDLQVEVPIKVEDEIGFLSRSFNGMVSSIRAAQKKLQDYADNLEDKVKERTRELKQTLDQVQALKTQQDGDYFLTAMLQRPLGSNHFDGKNLDVKFLVHQKKKFEFRNRKDEIGGDLCSAHRLELMGRSYLVFMNADAMGKSIQGAGGALVLGAVFESIITRTRLSSAAQRQHPERWLKNAFIELHKIFESFDGSMLISVVFGLVEEDTGMVYYINAEHPSSVLYRNGKASFLDDDMLFRKLGTQGVGNTVFVQMLQMQPGDIFICGSDGRDDLLLGHTEAGDRIINEDETQFLIVVEEANGNPDRIFELLKTNGEITDDLSLLHVQYTGPGIPVLTQDQPVYNVVRTARQQARQGNWNEALHTLETLSGGEQIHPAVEKELAQILFKLKDYSRGIVFARNYVDRVPSDTDMVYLTSFLYKKQRDLESAADYAERVRLRTPDNVLNLIHLADIYLHLGNPRRAGKMLERALELEPGNDRALKLQSMLREQTSAGV